MIWAGLLGVGVSSTDRYSCSESEQYSILERRLINKLPECANEEASVGEQKIQPLVSVIIPTFNSQRTIEFCLESIRKQTYRKIETQVVDRYSADGTVQIAKQFKAKTHPHPGGRSEARNYAAQRAAGDFLLFIDSDMVLTPRSIEECVSKSLKENLDAVILPEAYSAQGLLGKWRKNEKDLLSRQGAHVQIPRFFKRTSFLKAGGYDKKLVCGEDFDLVHRLETYGFKTGRVCSSILHLEGNPSLQDILSKAYHYGRTVPDLVRKGPSSVIRRYATMRLAFAKSSGTTFRSIGSSFGFTAMKTLEYTAYALGLLNGLLERISRRQSVERLRSVLSKHKSLIVNSAVILFITVFIFRNFLFTTDWPGGGDVLGFVSRAYLYGHDFRWLYMWRPYSFGFVEGVNLMDFFFMLLHLVFREPSWTVKAFMFLSYLTAAFSMYFFSYRYLRAHLASLAAALVYVLNQWLFSQMTEAHVDILFSYALAPLIFITLDNALRTGRLRDVLLLCGGLSLFVTSFHPECVVIYGIFLIILAGFHIFFPSRGETAPGRLIRFIRVIPTSVPIVVLLSAFFLVPFVTNIRSPYFYPSYEYPLEDAYWGSYQNVTDAFTLRAVEKWGYNNIVDVYSGLGLPDFPIYGVLFIVFLLAYCMLLIRRDRYTVFFAISAAISVFLAKGPHPPFGQAFVWAWSNIPHFAVFRAANRWIMMAAFSHAFFVSLLVHYLMRFVGKKINSRQSEGWFALKIASSRLSGFRRMAVSIEAFDTIVQKSRRILHIAGIILLAFVLLSGFLSCFFFFSQGLQVYTPPHKYLAPYEWLASQQDDYKVVSVGRSSHEWQISPDEYSDFASSAMQTTLGWGHDIGFDSSFIHDKPVLQDGGWDPRTRRFVDHLRFRLAREHLTDNLLKILGPFAYKYVVLPPYATNKTTEFFLNQKGAQAIFNETAMILCNEFAAPRFFATDHTMLVLGGFESFDALSRIDYCRLDETLLAFMSSDPERDRWDALSTSQALCFVNSDIMDLAMIRLNDETRIIYAADYAAPSIDPSKYWARMPSWRTVGALVLGGETMTTSGKLRISIPFELKSEGQFDLWLRVGFAPARGRLSVSVDGEPVGELCTSSPVWSKLEWVNMTRLNLTGKAHVVTLENDGTGYNDIDAIAIVKPDELDSKINETMSSLQLFTGRLLYLLGADNAFLGDSSHGWSWKVVPYNGYVICSENLGLNVAPRASANASSTSDTFEADLAIDEDLISRWASEKGVLPQWLELSWNTLQDLRGVAVTFESALATDYSVQTWNGSQWINQAVVTNNTGLKRRHEFAFPVKTDRLRILATDYSVYERVSIHELEAFSTEPTATARIVVPRGEVYAGCKNRQRARLWNALLQRKW